MATQSITLIGVINTIHTHLSSKSERIFISDSLKIAESSQNSGQSSQRFQTRSRSVSSSSVCSSHSKVEKKRKKRRKKCGNVLHFLKKILDDPTKHSVADWEDEERGLFRIKDRDRILQLWNKDKTRPVKCWDNFV